MAKTTVLTTGSINHSTDTLITFPKSKKTLVLSKNYSAKQLAEIDSFLTTHTIRTKTSSMSPQLQNCADRTFTNWEIENQYQSVPGKYLGICTNVITIYKAYRQYGFNSLYVSSTTDIDSARNDGFSYDSLMWGLSNSGTLLSIDASNSGGRHVGSYYIDEPMERNNWTGIDIQTVANYVGSSKKVRLGSYKWPVIPQYYEFLSNTTYGQVYGPILNYANNLYIMCDEYYGNCLGHTYEYWNEFHGYYGSKNIANWMDVVINNGNGQSPGICNYASTSWLTLLTTANGIGLNEVWLYAQGTGNEAAIANFCASAWQDSWLTRQQKGLVTEYRCAQNNCTSCSYPTQGTWELYDMWYDGTSRFVGY
jgi:hypothetical protein